MKPIQPDPDRPADTQRPAVEIRPPAAEIRPPAAEIRSPAAEIRPPAAGTWRPSAGAQRPPLLAGRPRAGKAQAGAVTVAVAALIAVPVPAVAAPAPTAPGPTAAAPVCAQAERYGGVSGARLLRLDTLDLGPLGHDGTPVTGVGVGSARSAVVTDGPINSAAVTRMVDGEAGGDLSGPVIQQAPPTNVKPAGQATAPGDAGPFTLGAGGLRSHAQWQPAMACGKAAGQTGRAETTLDGLSVLGGGRDALVTMTGRIGSRSLTGLERNGDTTRTVSTATMTAGRIDLAGGAVRLRIVSPPKLRTTMSTADGGEVSYVPPVVEVSGKGVSGTGGDGTARLDTSGDSVEIRLDPAQADTANPPAPQMPIPKGMPTQEPETSSSDQAIPPGGELRPDTQTLRGTPNPADADNKPGAGSTAGAGDTPGASTQAAGQPAGAGSAVGAGKPAPTGPAVDIPGVPEVLERLPDIAPLPAPAPLPLPPVPDLPPLGGTPEGAAVAGPGTVLRISLGDVRQASRGHAIAARVTAVKIAITRGKAADRDAPGYTGVVLDLGLGALEAASVAPEEPGAGSPAGQAPAHASGAGGGLPITGPRMDLMILTGVLFLLLGGIALVYGSRSRAARRREFSSSSPTDS